ncbi:hypothetical protein XENTR_v10010961 [Xenopus tropicalis]|nr:hypothetical protein XENTR_v10010961 [Xenopus tropicalis]
MFGCKEQKSTADETDAERKRQKGKERGTERKVQDEKGTKMLKKKIKKNLGGKTDMLKRKACMKEKR